MSKKMKYLSAFGIGLLVGLFPKVVFALLVIIVIILVIGMLIDS